MFVNSGLISRKVTETKTNKICLFITSVVESLPKVEKTGNQFLDDLLAMIYMVIHTYQDKHQVHVHCWYVLYKCDVLVVVYFK